MKLGYKLQKKIYDISLSLYNMPDTRNKHFSFLVRRNKIISIGWNKAFQTHPIAAKFGHRFNCIHSELDVINNFPYPFRMLPLYTLINVRVKYKSLRISHPCLKCINMLKFFGLKDVIYSTDQGYMICYLE